MEIWRENMWRDGLVVDTWLWDQEVPGFESWLCQFDVAFPHPTQCVVPDYKSSFFLKDSISTFAKC